MQNHNSTQAVEMVLKKKSTTNSNKVSETVVKNKKSDKKIEEKVNKRKIDEKQTKNILKTESNTKNKNPKNIEDVKKPNLEKKSIESKPKIVKPIDKNKRRDIKSTKTDKTEKIELTVTNKSDSEIDAENSIESLTITSNELIDKTEHLSETPYTETEDNLNKNNQELSTNNITEKSQDDIHMNTHEQVPVEKPEKMDTILSNELKKKSTTETEVLNNKSDKPVHQEKITVEKDRNKEIASNRKNSLINVENNDKISNDTEIRRPRTSLRPPSIRPSSSRPSAPRFKDSNVDVINNSSDSMPVAKVNIIVENYENQTEVPRYTYGICVLRLCNIFENIFFRTTTAA